ncbi:MAG TPA: C40 family peptidase [Streptosporangiaceae bacterium]|nr:C40 family peptidase [Streptosporangiaceae bacterium]
MVLVGLGKSLNLGWAAELRGAGLAHQVWSASVPALGAAASVIVMGVGAWGGPAMGHLGGGPAAGHQRAPVLAAYEMGPVPASQQAPPQVAPLGHLRQADLMVVSAESLPADMLASVLQVRDVRSAELLEAARVRLNGQYVAMLGVDPSRFRIFADKPTAEDTSLWRSVAAGDVAVSYTMGRQDGLPLGSLAEVTGTRQESLAVGGLGTVGIPGVDAVVSDTVARSLGFPMGNAMLVSVRTSHLATAANRIHRLVGKNAQVEPLVAPSSPASPQGASAGNGGGNGVQPWTEGLLSPVEVQRFLAAAESRVGRPYVWGGSGPFVFDCSGLVQWSLAQAGVVMPRVAADQALTGPAVPVSRLSPGDLLFYHTDPTAPNYVSHVAIYLGDGKMEQAPEPGMDVEIVPVDLGAEFAGAIAVSPRVAAAAAASPVG